MGPIRLNDNTAEDYLLAALLSDKLADYVLAEVTEDDFSSEKGVFIYRTVQEMRSTGEKADIVTCLPKLTASGVIGTQEYYSLVKIFTDREQLPSYIQRVKKATQRKEIFRMLSAAEDGLREQEDPAKIAQELGDALALRSDTGTKRTLITPKDMAIGVMEVVGNRMSPEKRREKVINTSFGGINRVFGGLEKSDLIIISAESGAGKSAFSMNLARDVGITQKRACAYLNSEMSTEQQQLRWASFLSGVSHSAIRAGEISGNDYTAIQKSCENLYKSQLYTLNMPDMQIANVLTELRLLHKRYGLEMAIVDYIGRMDTLNVKDTVKEWQLMLNAARMLKTLAQELDMVVIMVAQLTKDGGSLAQGSYMKHEADLWFNIRRWKDPGDLQKNYPWNCFLEVRKARNAESNNGLRLHFHGDTLTFTDDERQAREYSNKEQVPQGWEDVPQ